MKTFTRLLMLLLFQLQLGFVLNAQIAINPGTFSQNAWFIDNCDPFPSTSLPPSVWADADASGVEYVRIGGIDANFIPLYSWDGSFQVNAGDVLRLKEVINKIRANNMEPIIEVGYDPVCSNSSLSGISYQDAAKIAGNLVNRINNLEYPGQPIMNWIIANEPDLTLQCSPLQCSPSYGGFSFNTAGHAQQISQYIKEFSKEMKHASPNIQIHGPELATFGTDMYFSVNQLMNDLISNSSNSIMGPITTGNGSGKYFLDVITFHMYPNIINRSAAIANPSDMVSGFKGKLLANDGSNLKKGIVTMIQQNTTRTVNNLKIGLTEYNIGNSNGLHEVNDNNAVIAGNDYRSFIGGQWLAEMLSVGMNTNSGNQSWVSYMNFWSLRENGINNSPCTEGWGYISNCPSCQDKKRSTYYHFQMMAQNFTGANTTFLPNLNTASIPNTKAFAYHNTTAGEIGVMIMNQTQTSPSSVNSFRINFNNTDPTVEDIKVKLNIPTTTTTYACAISTESTVLLKFNATSGNLISRTEYNIEDAINNVPPKTLSPPPATDLYIRDTPTDDGTEPNPGDPWNLVDGTDVWVRNTADFLVQASPPRYANEHIHESPEWTTAWQPPTYSNQPFIYVKVRNRGCTTVTGTVKLYYHNITTNDHWNTCTGITCGSWTEIVCGDTDGNGTVASLEMPCTTQNVITLDAGEEGVIELPWNSVSDVSIFSDPTAFPRTHWCLLARLEPITGMEQINVSAANNAKAFNDIVQKNVAFANDFPGLACNGLRFGNLSEVPTVNRLDMVDMSSTFFTPANGLMSVDLGETLYNEWVAGGKIGSGITYGKSKYVHTSNGTTHTHDRSSPDQNPYTINLINPTAFIGNITLPPFETHPLCIEFNYYQGDRSTVPFPYSFRQYESKNRQYESKNHSTLKFTGAVKYYINKPECPPANAGTNVTIGRKCSASLSANPFVENAIYNWYNNTTGALVGTGQTIQVSPRVTTTYEVEIKSPNGCIVYALKTVTVNPKQTCHVVECPIIDFTNKIIRFLSRICGLCSARVGRQVCDTARFR